MAEPNTLVDSRPPSLLVGAVYGNAFAIGAVIMGFEMLGSRYIYPYFGAGIGMWAALISMVLLALAIGYFVGGSLTTRHRSLRIVGMLVAVAAAYLSLVPLFADSAMLWILDRFKAGAVGQLAAAAGLTLIPLSLLGTLSPVGVAALSTFSKNSGATAGWLYGVSTVGNIAGVLLTTFVFVPTIGSRAITYGFACTLIASAGTLAATEWLFRGSEATKLN